MASTANGTEQAVIRQRMANRIFIVCSKLEDFPASSPYSEHSPPVKLSY
jgi:hypothetical protein